MENGVGKIVRTSFDGPDVDHDRLIGFIDARNREDRERSSSAGESRQMIGEFIENTAFNGKALAFLRQIKKVALKDNGQAKAADIIRSLKVGLPMIENDILGQGTADMFEGDEPEPLMDGAGLDYHPYLPNQDVADDWPEDGQPAPPRDPQIAEDEDDFEAALAQVDDRVVPFTGTAG